MNNTYIFFGDTSKVAEFEAFNKGFRRDVFIQIDFKIFNPVFYDIIRIVEDFEQEYATYGYYDIEPNLILLKDVTTKSIIETSLKLIQQKFFDGLGFYTGNDFDKSNFIQLYPPLLQVF